MRGRVPAILSPARWAATQSPLSLLALRVLLIGNAGLLGVVAGLSAVFVAHPAGYVFGGAAGAAAVVLLGLVPYTNPRRGQSGRW